FSAGSATQRARSQVAGAAAELLQSVMPIRRFLAALVVCAPLVAQNPIQLKVDASDAPRRMVHVQMSMPAKPGPLTLLYPKWIPGEHGPTGPIENLVGLRVTSGGQQIRWRRDDVNLFAIHVEVPPGAASLDLAFD